jgi:hypothetical protein
MTQGSISKRRSVMMNASMTGSRIRRLWKIPLIYIEKHKVLLNWLEISMSMSKLIKEKVRLLRVSQGILRLLIVN